MILAGNRLLLNWNNSGNDHKSSGGAGAVKMNELRRLTCF